MRMEWRAYLLLILGYATVSCDRTPRRAQHEPARVVDSILPRAEALRRFQLSLTPVGELKSPYASRDSLVAAFVKALGDRDTAALASMAVSRAEFGYLYYPTNPQGLPPYDLGPGLMWDLLQQRSERGVRRALAIYGGQRFQLLSHDCGQGSSREGENTVVGPCVLHLRDLRGKSLSVGLISQIVERRGRYKILSFANKL
ncbi:MAG TPA: hypothetical protein VIG04_10175 [Gemmatimonadales bacterium]|jgi:hypothetical protein